MRFRWLRLGASLVRVKVELYGANMETIFWAGGARTFVASSPCRNLGLAIAGLY